MSEPESRTESKKESPETEATHTLEEARMVLPGIQALFGFQLVAVYNQPFARLLSAGEQRLHLAGVLITALAITLVMTPAAYHRQAEPHEISATFLRLSTVLLTLGMFTLMLSLAIDSYLIARIILEQRLLSAALTAGLGAVMFGLWFVLPLWVRRSKQRSSRRI